MYVHNREKTNLGPKERFKVINRNSTSEDLLHQQGKRKGGMDAEVFGMIAWNDVEAALKGTSKMFKM